MMHADTRAFLRHYLSRHIGTDIGSLYRDLKPQVKLMRAATRMSP